METGKYQDVFRTISQDTRFLDEAEALLAHDGELIKIVRPGYGPGPNRPDRELLGFTGWTNIIGETGDIRHLEQWAARYAAWLCGAEKPTRSAEEMQEALKVEVIEPWEGTLLRPTPASSI